MASVKNPSLALKKPSGQRPKWIERIYEPWLELKKKHLIYKAKAAEWVAERKRLLKEVDELFHPFSEQLEASLEQAKLEGEVHTFEQARTEAKAEHLPLAVKYWQLDDVISDVLPFAKDCPGCL